MRRRNGKRNAQKTTTTVKTHYVLIDYENVHVPSLARVIDPHFQVYLFLGPNNKRLPIDLVLAMHRLGARAQYILLETPGANALDFHLAYYLGILTTADPLGFFHIISKDTGFDSLIQHMKTLLSTLHTKLGKQRPVADIEAVYQALIERGYIRVEGLKVSYALPAESAPAGACGPAGSPPMA